MAMLTFLRRDAAMLMLVALLALQSRTASAQTETCPLDRATYCNRDSATAQAAYAGCFNTSTSVYACGDCSTVCPDNQPCANGTCACPARSPTYCAKGTNTARVAFPGCFDTRTTSFACGNCDTACSPGISCLDGFCGPRPGVPITPPQPSSPTTPASTPRPPPPPAAPTPRPGVGALPPITALTPAVLPPAKSLRDVGISSGQAPAQSPASSPAVSFPNTGLLICFPVGLSFTSNTSANGVVLNQTCAVLSDAQAPSPSSPTPAIAGSGRRLQQAPSPARPPPVEPFQQYFPSPGSSQSSAILTFYVPLDLFSLNTNRSAPSGNYSVGPRLTDPRVLLAASIIEDCPAKGQVDVYKLQAALLAASEITNDTSVAVSAATDQALAYLTAVDVCPLFFTSTPPPGPSSTTPQASALSPSDMAAAAAPNITELGKAFNPGLGITTRALVGTPYTFPSVISAISATAWTNSSGCSSAPAVGTGQGVQLCLQIQVQASAFPSSAALSPSPAQARSGIVQTCNVEIKFRSFIPYTILFGPPTALSPDPTAFSGNFRDFSYDNGGSLAELLGTFTIRDQNFSDAPRVQFGLASLTGTQQYYYSQTTRVGTSMFEGNLNTVRPSILQRASRTRTPSNLVLHGLGGESSGFVQVHLDAGDPLLRYAPYTAADLQINFTSVPAADGSGFNYYYSLDGNIDNFPSFELYINKVLAYYSTARNPSFLPPPSAVLGSRTQTGQFAIPGCPKPTSCGTVNEPLTASGGQSPTEDVRFLQVAGNATVQLQYDSFTIPDRFYVLSIPDNAVLYDTAWVGSAGQCVNIPGLQVSGPGAGNQRITIPPGTNTVAVVVDSPCEDTRWTYTVACISSTGK